MIYITQEQLFSLDTVPLFFCAKIIGPSRLIMERHLEYFGERNLGSGQNYFGSGAGMCTQEKIEGHDMSVIFDGPAIGY